MARRKKGEDINGWLVVDKPRDLGSTDVVNKTRRWFDAKKNGHTGTLDPFATGVLPIAFGEATKLVPYVTDGIKEYEFIIEWGTFTTTDDSEGEICGESALVPQEEEIKAVLPCFVGKITQIPPVYSAIKINGERAYKLARAGRQVEMPSREIEIFELDLLEILPPRRAKLRVKCSKGTYIRTLGHDLAVKLGTAGHLEELRRTRCGNFSLKDAIKLENIEKIVHIDGCKEILLPVITSLRDIADLAVTEADAARLALGQSLSPRSYDVSSLIGKTVKAVYNAKLVAIVRIEETKIAPVRVFNY